MKPNLRNLIIVSLLLVMGAAIGTAVLLAPNRGAVKAAAVTPAAAISTINYAGVEGKTALELLNATAQIETKGTGANAFVVSINGRTADDTKKEFWAFYVNDKQAEVGAGSYVTKNSDQIRWQIETY